MNDFFGMLTAGIPANGQTSGVQARASRVTANRKQTYGGFADVVSRAAQKQSEDPSVRKKSGQSTPQEAMALLSGSAMATQTPPVKEDMETDVVSPDTDVTIGAAANVSTAQEAFVFLQELFKNEYGGDLIYILEDAQIVVPEDLENLSVSEILEILRPQVQAALMREEAAVSAEGLPTAEEWELVSDGAAESADMEGGAAIDAKGSAPDTASALPEHPLYWMRAALQRLARVEGQDTSRLPDAETAALMKEVPDRLVVSAMEGEEALSDLSSEPEAADNSATVAPRKEIPSVQDQRLLAFSRSFAPVTQMPQIPADVQVSNVTPSQMISQIVQFASLRQQAEGTTQLQLQLNPAHLGRVNIVLTATADGITAQIRADNDAVRGILSSNVQALQTQLKEMGITMKEIDISGSDMSRQFTQNPGQNASHFQQGEQQGYVPDRVIAMSRFLNKPEMEPYMQQAPAPMPVPEEGGVDFRA